MGISRRQMLQRCGCGFGYLAFSSILADVAQAFAAAENNPLAMRNPHFAPRAKRVIFLFMHGGPSHVDTFDYKPLLAQDAGKTLPKDFVKGSFVDPNAKLMPSPFAFKKCGQSGHANTPLSQAQIHHIRNGEMSLELQRQQLDFVQQLNREHLHNAQVDDQLEGVIESYELAFRMQTEAPELTDLSKESAETLSMYGVDQTPTDDFARQCLLARRFAEKGVRFIQVSHSFKWDS